jgi:dephospho-CoA kinase
MGSSNFTNVYSHVYALKLKSGKFMLVIGLTGGIGSGKTTVAKLFAHKGITVIDTDQLSRDVTQKGQPALQTIAKKFGPEILLPNGTLDRTALRKKIFNDPANKIWLESLLHPLIRAEMQRQAQAATSPYCIVVIPLLFETEKNPLISRVLVIDAPEDEQIRRTRARDNATHEDVVAILKTQSPRAKRLAGADDIIENNGQYEDLIPQVDKLNQYYLALANKKEKI